MRQLDWYRNCFFHLLNLWSCSHLELNRTSLIQLSCCKAFRHLLQWKEFQHFFCTRDKTIENLYENQVHFCTRLFYIQALSYKKTKILLNGSLLVQEHIAFCLHSKNNFHYKLYKNHLRVQNCYIGCCKSKHLFLFFEHNCSCLFRGSTLRHRGCISNLTILGSNCSWILLLGTDVLIDRLCLPWHNSKLYWECQHKRFCSLLYLPTWNYLSIFHTQISHCSEHLQKIQHNSFVLFHLHSNTICCSPLCRWLHHRLKSSTHNQYYIQHKTIYSNQCCRIEHNLQF